MTEILAKSSGETLSDHTIQCLKAAQALFLTLPLSDDLKQLLQRDVLLAVAMHDVGKAAVGFQKMLAGEQKDWQGKRHEILSAAFASCLSDLSPAVILAILTHHKRIPADGLLVEQYGCLPWEQIPMPGFESPLWEEMAQEWKENLDSFIQVWRRVCDYMGEPGLAQHSQLQPISLNPSWLESGSGKRSQTKCIEFSNRYYASLVRGLTIASDHLGSAHVVPPKIPKFADSRVLRCNPRPFQQKTAQTVGSAVLRAPTGSGKTEAALLWAQRNQKQNGRLFYVLPYTASINAMHRRLSKIFGGSNVGLLHHRATASLYSLLESDHNITSRLERQKVASTLTSLAHEIWFPIRVCTPHQILRYTLRGKGWEYMLAEFPNASFILDEIHAYDPRVVGLTLGSVRLLSQWGATFLFVSATLPAFLRNLIWESIGRTPMIHPLDSEPEDRKILETKRHKIEIKETSLVKDIDTLLQAIESRSSTLIVCNHVGTARHVYSLLKTRVADIAILHGRFNQEDRNAIEASLGQQLPRVLVATQVVEVSLDLDFDQGFLEPAPIDAVVQRMGRINRYGTRPPARITIFSEQVHPYNLYCSCGGSHAADCRVSRSLSELGRMANPISEHDLVEAADRLYGDGYQNEDKRKFEEGLQHPDVREFQSRLIAGSHQDWVESVIEKTDGIVEVLPKCLVEKFREKEEQGLWLEANQLLVPIRTRSLAWLKVRVNTSHDPWIADIDYSETGLEL